MKRRSLLKAIGAVLFGGAAAGATDEELQDVKDSLESLKEPPGVALTDFTSSLTNGPVKFRVYPEASPQDDIRKDWKLYRVLYDYDGWKDIEGDPMGDERFQERLKKVKDDREIGWLIGVAIEINGETQILERLEGSKANLEYVLGLMQADGRTESFFAGGKCGGWLSADQIRKYNQETRP